jgi:hypothetical protein
MPQVISGIVLWKVLATSVVVNESVKKSNASQVQPRKAICPESYLALQFNMCLLTRKPLCFRQEAFALNKIDIPRRKATAVR